MALAVSWLLFPLFIVAVTLGLGLAVTRVLKQSVPYCLLPPIGLATLIVLVSPVYAFGAGSYVALALTVLVAVYGLTSLINRKPAESPPVAAATAAIAAFGLSSTPILLSGQATFAGYNILNDTAINFVLIDHLSVHGSRLVDLPPSSYSSAINGYLSTAYPLGAHEALATLKSITTLDVASLYQPFLSVLIALTALSATYLLSESGVKQWLAAGGGFASAVAYLPFSYAMQGSIKELAIITFLMCAASVSLLMVKRKYPLRAAIMLAIVVSAALSTFSAASLPWTIPLILITAVCFYTLSSQASLKRLAWIGAVLLCATILMSIPTVLQIPDFLKAAKPVLINKTEVGNLFADLRKSEVFGVWLNGDYRRAPEQPFTNIYIALVGILTAIGVFWSVTKRKPGPYLYAVPALVAYLIILKSGSPWATAKTLAIMTPASILFATSGIAMLMEKWHRTALMIALIALSGLLLSDILVHRAVSKAPLSKFHEQKTIDKRFAGQGPILVNEPEEYAKHFLRHVDAVNPYEAWVPSPAKLRDPYAKTYGQYYDLDKFLTDYIQSFPLLLVRNSPSASRAPANYRKVFSGNHYNVWKRARRL